MTSKNQTDEQVAALEEFFTEIVTQTPIVLQFTAADAAEYIGYETVEVSHMLQRYRDVQGGLTLSTSQFVIATFNRGRGSVWFILTWPNMRQGEAEIAGEILATHEIMSVIREDVKPMLRNIRVQFGPAVVRNRKVNRRMLDVHVGKLDGYANMVSAFQRNVSRVKQPNMRKVAKALTAVLDATVDEIESTKDYLVAI